MARHRSTHRELFLDRLRELTGTEQKLISNNNLRTELGWEQERYNRTKEELKRENIIIIGQGYGGTVGLVSAPGMKG